MDKPVFSRRAAISVATGALGAVMTPQETACASARDVQGRLKQSVARWCFGDTPLEELCDHAKAMGMQGIDLLEERDWATVSKRGLICSMAMQIGTIPDGWNRLENHDRLVADAERLIPRVGDAGLPNLITFSGNRRGISDAAGMDNCATGLARITKLAEKHNVLICMELLNSKRTHADYQCDHTAWGAALAKRLSSPRFKLLYDIFHMQIMEGDLCDTIRENIQYIGHFHTGGVPGRNEIDETQEITYHRVAQAIADTGYRGFVAHEFIPRRKDKMDSLQQAVRICTV